MTFFVLKVIFLLARFAKEGVISLEVDRIRLSWGYRLKTTFYQALDLAQQSADERSTLIHDHPLDQAARISDLKSIEGRYRALASVISGLSRSWDQGVPGLEKPFYTFLAKNGFGTNGKSALSIKDLKAAGEVFYSGWILPIGSCKEKEDQKLPIVGSSKLLFAKCPCCGKMQLVVRRYRRKGIFWWFRRTTDFFILCLDCQCVYIVHKGIEILTKAN